MRPIWRRWTRGDVAGAFLRCRQLPPEALFVIVDDLNLPLGRIRVRPAGSSGGHNGLLSIEQALGSTAYPRLRLGIGAPTRSGEASDHVLAPFDEEERGVLGPSVERAADATYRWLQGADLQALMGEFNPDEPAGPAGSDAQQAEPTEPREP